MISKRVSNLWRGIAILIVIASHYAGWMYVEPVHQAAHDIISTFGPYGVDIFFLLSGYGLTKSAAKKGITLSFVLRRIFSIYVPYLLIVTGINLYIDGFSDIDASGWFKFFTGYDYWYMNILFIFYILFMIIWKLKEVLRLPLMTVAVIAVTVIMFNIGRADFWELSNSAFLIGIYAATIEKKWPDKMKNKLIHTAVILVSLVCFIICTKMMIDSYGMTDNSAFIWELVSDIFFTLLICGLCYLTPNIGWVLPAVGSQSMYIYLLHQTLFWALTFKFDEMSYFKSTVIVGLISIAAAMLIGFIYNKIYSLFVKKR